DRGNAGSIRRDTSSGHDALRHPGDRSPVVHLGRRGARSCRASRLLYSRAPRDATGSDHRYAPGIASYQTPTCPRTESISFAGSNPTPFLNTVSTRLMSAMVF